MKRMIMAAMCLVAMACDSAGPGGEEFLAVLSGLNEVPPNLAVQSAGTASFTATDNGIAFSVTVQGMTGIQAAHIHVGAAGVIGPAVVDLYAGPTTGSLSGILAQGTITASNLTALSMDSLKVLLRNGGAYVNVHTTSLPNGEIRGQVHQN